MPGEPPLNVTAVNSSSTSVLVSWEPPTLELTFGILRGFEIRYYNTSRPENSSIINNISAADRMYDIKQLLEFTNYSIEVSAITVGNGPFSSPVTVVTDEDSKLYYNGSGTDCVTPCPRTVPGVISQPPIVDRSGIRTTSAVITWDPPSDPNGIILNYAIRYVAVAMASGSGMQQLRGKRQTGGSLLPQCIEGGPDNINRTDIVNGTTTSHTLTDLSE